MARLPAVGSDSEQWGELLNEFLLVSHRTDGTLHGSLEIVNVKDFGAKGDGQADDTGAIQSAINAASEKSHCVFFPAGNYKIASGLSVENISLKGIAGFTNLLPTSAVKIALSVNTTNNETMGYPYPVIIEGISIVGSGNVGTTGLKLGTNVVSAHIKLHRMEIYYFQGTGARGLHIVNAVGTDIENCVFAKNDVNVYIEGASGLPTTTSFRECNIRESSGGAGAEIKEAAMVRFDSCIMEANAEEGVKVAPGDNQNCVLLTISKCWFEANQLKYLNDPERANRYSLLANGTAAGSTVEIALRDTYFNGNDNSEKAIKLNRIVNSVIDNSRVFSRQRNISISHPSSIVHIINWHENNSNYSLVIDNSDNAVIYDGAWSTWTPIVSAFGDVSLANTLVTTARFKRIFKTIFVDLYFTTTPATSTAGLIITLPLGVIPRDTNTHFPALVSDNGNLEMGYIQTGGSDGIYLRRLGGNFSASPNTGGKFTAAFEIQ